MEQVLNKGQPISFTNVVVPIHRDGIEQDVYWDYSYSLWLSSDGSVEGVLDIAFDVTAAVTSQRALAASENRATRILKSIGDAVIVADATLK